MIKCTLPKGWERLKAKVPFDPKGKQEGVHNMNIHTCPLRRMAYTSKQHNTHSFYYWRIIKHRLNRNSTRRLSMDAYKPSAN